VLGEEPASVSLASYPEIGSRDEAAEQEMMALQEVITGVRAIRADLNVPAKARVTVHLKSTVTSLVNALKSSGDALKAMTGSVAWQFGASFEAMADSARKVLSFGELFVPLAGMMIDVVEEEARLVAELAAISADLARTTAKLANDQFLKRAPRDVVEKEQGKRDEFAQKKERLEANLASLGG